MGTTDGDISIFEQACEMIRHLQSQIFTALTAFLIMSGALFTFAMQNRAAGKFKYEFIIPCLAGILVSIIFAANQWRISQRVKFYTEIAVTFGKRIALHPDSVEPPPGNKFWQRVSQTLLMLLYGGTLVIWLVLFCA